MTQWGLFKLTILLFLPLCVLTAPPKIRGRIKRDLEESQLDEKGIENDSENEISNSMQNDGSQQSSKADEKWTKAIRELFTKWGYKDDDIPEPFGSKKLSNSAALSPEFAHILKALSESIPTDLRSSIESIVREDGINSDSDNSGNMTKLDEIDKTVHDILESINKEKHELESAADVKPTEIHKHDHKTFCAELEGPCVDEFADDDTPSSSLADELQNSQKVDQSSVGESSSPKQEVLAKDKKMLDDLISELNLFMKNASKMTNDDTIKAKSDSEQVSSIVHEIETMAEESISQVEHGCSDNLQQSSTSNTELHKGESDGGLPESDRLIIENMKLHEMPVDVRVVGNSMKEVGIQMGKIAEQQRERSLDPDHNSSGDQKQENTQIDEKGPDESVKDNPDDSQTDTATEKQTSTSTSAAPNGVQERTDEIDVTKMNGEHEHHKQQMMELIQKLNMTERSLEDQSSVTELKKLVQQIEEEHKNSQSLLGELDMSSNTKFSSSGKTHGHKQKKNLHEKIATHLQAVEKQLVPGTSEYDTILDERVHGKKIHKKHHENGRTKTNAHGIEEHGDNEIESGSAIGESELMLTTTSNIPGDDSNSNTDTQITSDDASNNNDGTDVAGISTNAESSEPEDKDTNKIKVPNDEGSESKDDNHQVVVHHGEEQFKVDELAVEQSEANFNGGIHQSIDSLKEQYPGGRWPNDNLENKPDQGSELTPPDTPNIDSGSSNVMQGSPNQDSANNKDEAETLTNMEDIENKGSNSTDVLKTDSDSSESKDDNHKVVVHHGEEQFKVDELAVDPSETNFNGGIHQSIDSLKEQFPNGKWPDNNYLQNGPDQGFKPGVIEVDLEKLGGDSDNKDVSLENQVTNDKAQSKNLQDVNDNSIDQNPDSPGSGSLIPNVGDSHDHNHSELEVLDLGKDLDKIEKAGTSDELNPERLDEIIRAEQSQSASGNSHHHVQENLNQELMKSMNNVD